MQNTSSGARTGFWSSQTLAQHIDKIVDHPDPANLREACYRLSMGNEIFLTQNLTSTRKRSTSVRQLKKKETFVIEPGHFALMITLETITMPPNALGFLSIQTDVKFKGLVNISGFHVDPGSDGKITFAVFNAGPNSVHVRQGDPIFRLWIADLDADDQYPNQNPLPSNIAMKTVNNISSPLESLQGLAKKVEQIDNKLNNLKVYCAALLTALAALLAFAYYAYNFGKDVALSRDVPTLSGKSAYVIGPRTGGERTTNADIDDGHQAAGQVE